MAKCVTIVALLIALVSVSSVLAQESNDALHGGLPDIPPPASDLVGQVCTIRHGTMLIKVGMTTDWFGLQRAMLAGSQAGKREDPDLLKAARDDEACTVPDGTKVIITGQDSPWSVVRVLAGPNKGCVGETPIPWAACR